MTVPLDQLPITAAQAWARLSDEARASLGDALTALWGYGGTVFPDRSRRLGDLDTVAILERVPDERTTRNLEQAEAAIAREHSGTPVATSTSSDAPLRDWSLHPPGRRSKPPSAASSNTSSDTSRKAMTTSSRLRMRSGTAAASCTRSTRAMSRSRSALAACGRSSTYRSGGTRRFMLPAERTTARQLPKTQRCSARAWHRSLRWFANICRWSIPGAPGEPPRWSDM